VTPTPDDGIVDEQGELFRVWRHHAIFTNSPLVMLDAEADHRKHAVIEQVIADLKNGPLAQLPSGKVNANAAWLVLAAIAFNLTRAAGCLAWTFHARATTATVRRQLAVSNRFCHAVCQGHAVGSRRVRRRADRVMRAAMVISRPTTGNLTLTTGPTATTSNEVEEPDRPADRCRPTTQELKPRRSVSRRSHLRWIRDKGARLDASRITARLCRPRPS
jgi:hypothetical protein